MNRMVNSGSSRLLKDAAIISVAEMTEQTITVGNYLLVAFKDSTEPEALEYI